MSNGLYQGVLHLHWFLRSPLSHIGETIGNDAHLNETRYVDATGEDTVRCFYYNGNAYRGMWRDMGAKYFQDNLSSAPGEVVKIPPEWFHRLWSGGSIEGEQKVDAGQNARLRELLPIISNLGTAIGSGTIESTLDSGYGYLLCRETEHLVPSFVRGKCKLPYRRLRDIHEFSRFDDAKSLIKAQYISDPSLYNEDALELGGEAGKKDAKKKKKERPQQMRYSVMAVVPGARLYSHLRLREITPVALGALVSAIHEWSKRPVIGGKNAIGMGEVDLDIELQRFGSKEREPFMSVRENIPDLSDEAEEAKARYDELLRGYQKFLAENRGEIRGLVGG